MRIHLANSGGDRGDGFNELTLLIEVAVEVEDLTS